MNITFSNLTLLDKTIDELIRIPNYNVQGIHIEEKDGVFFKEILLKIIPEKIKQIPFDDVLLTEKECAEIEIPFANFILSLLSKRELNVEGDKDVEFLGKMYDLQIRSEHRRIWLYIKMHRLLKTCLLENKPVYLRIHKDSIDN
jgi:hypothetical protein